MSDIMTKVAGGRCALKKKDIKFSWKALWEELISKGKTVIPKKSQRIHVSQQFAVQQNINK